MPEIVRENHCSILWQQGNHTRCEYARFYWVCLWAAMVNAKMVTPPNWSFNGTVYEPPHDKTNKITCAPSEDFDQPGHPPSLIIVFAVRMKKAWVLGYLYNAQRWLWSEWADAQADPSLHWAHRLFCWFCHAAAQLFDRPENDHVTSEGVLR